MPREKPWHIAIHLVSKGLTPCLERAMDVLEEIRNYRTNDPDPPDCPHAFELKGFSSISLAEISAGSNGLPIS